jgi:hypothetical protein
MSASTDIAVVGTFRSGTNLMKYLLERNFSVRCSFNALGWKHALAPTWASPISGHRLPAAPLVVMVKEPVQQNVSFFAHWMRTRPGLAGNRTFSEFIRSQFLVHDNSHGGRGPKYLFATPTDYWNQFYFSYLFWDDAAPRQQLVRLELLERDAGSLLARLGKAFSLVPRERFDPSIPAHRLVPTPDGQPAQTHATERQQSSVGELSSEDRAFILSRISPVLMQRIYDQSG